MLAVWNRYGDIESVANRFEARGGIVLVAENGYLGAGGVAPKADAHAGVTGCTVYAVARHAHNGRGHWPEGDGSRWARLGVALQPLRDGGDYHLIAPNRSFGMAGGVMSFDWAEKTAEAYRKRGLKVKVRHHPGNNRSPVPLEKDLAGAASVTIWSSSVGVHALVAGVPVICAAPWWICKDAALRTIEQLAEIRADVWTVRRLAALERMAWAQWTVDEIASGEPFRKLCGTSTPAVTLTA